MSTRCMIRFGYKGKQGELITGAMVYRHGDGYPDGDNGVLADLARFFEAVEKDTDDHRYGDPEYLAAKWVVWTVRDLKKTMDKALGDLLPKKNGPLNFLSCGVSMHAHTDIDYDYFLDCSAHDGSRPIVMWRADSEETYKTLKVSSPRKARKVAP